MTIAVDLGRKATNQTKQTKKRAPVFKGTRLYRLNVTVVIMVIAIIQLVQYPNKSAKEGHPTQEVN